MGGSRCIRCCPGREWPLAVSVAEALVGPWPGEPASCLSHCGGKASWAGYELEQDGHQKAKWWRGKEASQLYTTNLNRLCPAEAEINPGKDEDKRDQAQSKKLFSCVLFAGCRLARGQAVATRNDVC